MEGEITEPLTAVSVATSMATYHNHNSDLNVALAPATAQNFKKRTRPRLSDCDRADPGESDATAADHMATGAGEVVVLPSCTSSMHPPAKRIKHAALLSSSARVVAPAATGRNTPSFASSHTKNVSPMMPQVELKPVHHQPIDALARPTHVPPNTYATHHPSCWFCPYSPFADTSLTLSTPSILKHTYATMTKGPLLSGHVSLVPVHHVGNWHCIDPSALRAKFASVRALALAAVNELVMMQHVATRHYVAAGNVPVTWQVVGRDMGEGSKRPQHAYCQMVGVPSVLGLHDPEQAESGSVSAAATGTHIEDADSRDTKVELVSIRTKFMFKSFAAPRSSETRSRHVTDRIASAFATLVTASGIESLAPVPAVYEFKVTGSHLLGSLTRTLYFVRANHTVSGLGAAAKINLMGPHAAMLVGDRLLFAGGEVDWSIPRRAIVEGGKLDKTREDWRVVQRTTAAETRERDRWVNGWEDEIERVWRQMEDEKEVMKISEGEVDVGFYSLGGWTREHVIATRKEEHEQESAASGGKSARSMVVDETTGTGAE